MHKTPQNVTKSVPKKKNVTSGGGKCTPCVLFPLLFLFCDDCVVKLCIASWPALVIASKKAPPSLQSIYVRKYICSYHQREFCYHLQKMSGTQLQYHKIHNGKKLKIPMFFLLEKSCLQLFQVKMPFYRWNIWKSKCKGKFLPLFLSIIQPGQNF